jgi:hypothetical protein
LAGGLYDKASWLLIPSQVEEDFVRAFKPTDNSGSLSFTRASDATRTNVSGVVERTPWNLLQQSETFDNATGWSILGTRLTFSKVTGPTGTNNAYLFTEVAATDSHNVFTVAGNRPTSEAGRTYTVSAYFKAGTRRYCGIAVGIAGSGVHVFVDTTNWTITDAKRFSTNTNWVYLSSSVQADLNGFYRVSLTFRTDAALSMSTAIFASNVSTSPAGEASYLGDGSTIISTAAQLVEGTDAKPYFPTTNRQDVPRLDYRNADGTVNSCPRLLLEPQRTNGIRNSTMVGAVAGSPGTIPTNWDNASMAGLTRTVVGLGTENGLQYIDFRFAGTATSTAITIWFETTTQIAAVTGQTWTNSIYTKLISGSALGYQLTNREQDASGVTLRTASLSITPTSTLQRFAYTRTNDGTGTAFVRPSLWVTLTSGATYDFTIRIAAPQMELGAYATTFIPTTTAAVTRLLETFSRSNVFTDGYISSAGGTWFVDLANNLSLGRDGSSGSFWIGDNSNYNSVQNALAIRHLGGTTALRVVKTVSGAGTALFTTTTETCKIAIKWNGTTADVFVNGTKVVNATPFTATNMEFLSNVANQVPHYFNQLALFPAPLTDEELVTITTL